MIADCEEIHHKSHKRDKKHKSESFVPFVTFVVNLSAIQRFFASTVVVFTS
jgi:hypothetical protein